MEETISIQNNTIETHRANNVANGASKKKKKSFFQKFMSTIVPGDAESIKDYLILDVVIPTIKRSILDAVSIAINGEAYESRRGGMVPAQKVSWRNDYHGMYQNGTSNRKRYSTYDYDSIVFETKGAAEAVLSELDEVMDQYHMVSVLDLYDAAGLDCDHTANDWGWYDIRSAEAIRTMNGEYILKMPKVRPLKQ